MIRRVYEQAARSDAKAIYVATDDKRIVREVESFGGHAVITGENNPTGTDRVFDAVRQIGLKANDVVVNVQGDEPLIPPSAINKVAGLITLNAHMSTLCEVILNPQEIFDPNVVKVTIDAGQNAMYFSRAPIPWVRNHFDSKSVPKDVEFYRHLGIYAYTVEMLQKYVEWDSVPLEELEKLEQLRVLFHGEIIKIAISPEKIPPGIDIPGDVEPALRALKESR